MITALFVTRFIMNCFYSIGLEGEKLYGKKVDKKPIQFLQKRKIFCAISAIMIVIGIVGMGMNKSKIGDIFNYGLDFKGGTSTNVTFNEDMSLEDISSKVVPVVESVTKDASTQTQKVQGTNQVIIKTRTLTKDEREQLNQSLVSKFGVDESKITAESISGAVSAEMRMDAI